MGLVGFMKDKEGRGTRVEAVKVVRDESERSQRETHFQGLVGYGEDFRIRPELRSHLPTNALFWGAMQKSVVGKNGKGREKTARLLWRGKLRSCTCVLMLFISESEAHNLTFLVKRSSKQTFAESKRVCTFPGILLFEFLEIVDIHMKKLNKYIKKKRS